MDVTPRESELASGPLAEHRYAQPGTYRATLAVADRAGCSTAFLFTGQSATCNGSAIASSSATLTATDTTPPVLRLFGARRQALGPRLPLGPLPQGELLAALEGDPLRPRPPTKAPPAAGSLRARAK